MRLKMMINSRLLLINALVAALALEVVVVLNSSARANTGAGQRLLSSDGKAKKSNEPVSELNDDSQQSEMRAPIERYVADRGSLARFYTVEASPTRHARLKQFYSDWLTSLAKLNFD